MKRVMPASAEQRVIVTGAASGIGLGISELFINRGSRVLMFDVNADALVTSAARLGPAAELGKLGVRANAVCPGMIKSPLLDATGRQLEEATGTSFENWIIEVQGRMGFPSDIAAMVAFLASDEASLVTGAVIPVDGGVTSRIL